LSKFYFRCLPKREGYIECRSRNEDIASTSQHLLPSLLQPHDFEGKFAPLGHLRMRTEQAKTPFIAKPIWDTSLARKFSEMDTMTRFYEPDLTVNFDNPFVRDANNKLLRRSYWLDMNDHTLVMVMTKGIGANLTNDEKRAHLADIRREHLIDQVCVQEILPPEK
jgi:hypothetical protein